MSDNADNPWAVPPKVPSFEEVDVRPTAIVRTADGYLCVFEYEGRTQAAPIDAELGELVRKHLDSRSTGEYHVNVKKGEIKPYEDS